MTNRDPWCPEVCYDLPEGAGGKGWDVIIVVLELDTFHFNQIKVCQIHLCDVNSEFDPVL